MVASTEQPSLRDDFRAPTLDPARWLACYLPEWSSREETAAFYDLTGDGLRLHLPVDAGLWLPEDHAEPLRVSGIQSGTRSGPVGSTDGQQSFDPDLVVREAQPRFEGWLVTEGRVEIRCRMNLSARSMAAMWLAGFEDEPGHGGELCAVEIFGRSIADGMAEVGVGVKEIHDPALRTDFVAPRLSIGVDQLHSYAVDWSENESVFTVDGEVIHRSPQGVAYPMQIMIAVFDFPAWSDGTDNAHVPELIVDHVESGPSRLRPPPNPDAG